MRAKHALGSDVVWRLWPLFGSWLGDTKKGPYFLTPHPQNQIYIYIYIKHQPLYSKATPPAQKGKHLVLQPRLQPTQRPAPRHPAARPAPEDQLAAQLKGAEAAAARLRAEAAELRGGAQRSAAALAGAKLSSGAREGPVPGVVTHGQKDGGGGGEWVVLVCFLDFGRIGLKFFFLLVGWEGCGKRLVDFVVACGLCMRARVPVPELAPNAVRPKVCSNSVVSGL